VLGGSSACGACCDDDGVVRRFDYMRAKDAVRVLAKDLGAFGLSIEGGDDEGGEEEEEEEAGLLGAAAAQKKKAAAAAAAALKTKAAPLAADATAEQRRLAAARAANEALAKLVRAGLLFRAERRFQKPKPGRKRRARWPRTLVPLLGAAPGARPPALLTPGALASILAGADEAEALAAAAKSGGKGGAKANGGAAAAAEPKSKAAAAAAAAPKDDPDAAAAAADADTFYVWSYDRPTSWLFYAGAGALLLCCAAVPLYPLAPHPVRLAVLYLLLALLGLIVGTVAIRGLVFSLVWILTGRALWLLPNLLSEDVPISQVLRPLVSLEPPSKAAAATPRQRALRLAARVGAAALVLGAGALLARHGPSGGELRKAAGEANDALLAYMETMAGGATKRLHNGTDDSAAAPGAAGGGGGKKAAAGGNKAGGAAAAAAKAAAEAAAAAPEAPPPIPEDDDEGEEEKRDEEEEDEEEEDDEAAEKKKKEEL